MTGQLHQDPTEFFAVVGAPYIGERHADGHYAPEHSIDDRRLPRFELGISSFCAAFCIVALGVSLLANTGAAKLVEVAQYAVNY